MEELVVKMTLSIASTARFRDLRMICFEVEVSYWSSVFEMILEMKSEILRRISVELGGGGKSWKVQR